MIEKVYPFMACPDEHKRLDPLEGCGSCKSRGYHQSIPNPEWANPPVGKRRWHEVETVGEELMPNQKMREAMRAAVRKAVKESTGWDEAFRVLTEKDND